MIFLGSFAVNPTNTFFIDFGTNDVTNGNSTTNPDLNNNYWNNFTNSDLNSSIQLVNKSNLSAGYWMLVTTAMSKNGILNGGLLTPSASLLGNMAIASATQDYFYSSTPGSFMLRGLNPSKGYKFYAFGSRNTAEVRTTQYVFNGKNTFTGVNQTSGFSLGGGTINQNTQTFLVSDPVYPTDSGTIAIQLSIAAGTYFHLNMMKIEEYDNVITISTNDTITANSPNFSYVGRVDFTNNKKPLFAYANTTIRTKFQGTSVSMLLNQYAGASFSENSFYAIVDNGAPLKIIASVGKTNYLIADKLDNTTHSLEIIKITEGYCGQCEFIGLILDKGKVLEMPDALPALRIEYYGASSTGGYGIEGGARPASDNSYKADPAVCARKLNAQLNVVSLSGFGMAIGWSVTSVIGTIWDKTIPVLTNLAPANNTWDFSRYTPDVVVLELGTNDYNAPGGLKTTLTVEQYKSVYKDFISKLRVKYPNAKIVCTNSYMLPDPGFAIISNAVQSAVSEVVTSGDKKIYYYGFSKMIGGGYNGHPGVTDGTNNGLAMAAFIKDSVLNVLNNTAVLNLISGNVSLNTNLSTKEIQLKFETDPTNANVNIFSIEGKLLYSAKINSKETRIKFTELNSTGVIITRVNTNSEINVFKSVM